MKLQIFTNLDNFSKLRTLSAVRAFQIRFKPSLQIFPSSTILLQRVLFNQPSKRIPSSVLQMELCVQYCNLCMIVYWLNFAGPLRKRFNYKPCANIALRKPPLGTENRAILLHGSRFDRGWLCNCFSIPNGLLVFYAVKAKPKKCPPQQSNAHFLS